MTTTYVHLDDIVELATDGHTFGQIAARLDLSKDAISARLRRTDDTTTATAIRRRLHHVGVAASGARGAVAFHQH